jgi:sulfate permease, SulP family
MADLLHAAALWNELKRARGTDVLTLLPLPAAKRLIVLGACGVQIDVETVRRLWRRERGEACVVAATFAASVALSVEAGVLVGVLAALALFLRRLQRQPARCVVQQVRS